MEIRTFDSAPGLGEAAALTGAAELREAIARTGSATAVLATGASQFACAVEEAGAVSDVMRAMNRSDRQV